MFSVLLLLDFLKSDDKEEECDSFDFDEKCPFCNNGFDIVAETDDFGLFCSCTNCNIIFREYEYGVSIESVPTTTKIKYLYEHDSFSWGKWRNIGLGEYTPDEQKEFDNLVKLGATYEICPICKKNFLEKYEKKGLFSFNSLICINCKSRFKIVKDNYNLDDSEVAFIYSSYIQMPIWEYAGKRMKFSDLKRIIESSRVTYENNNMKNQVIYQKNNSENNVQENNYNELMEININSDPIERIYQIKTLNGFTIKKIIRLRELGIVINSYDHLKDILNLDEAEIDYIKREIIITDNDFNFEPKKLNDLKLSDKKDNDNTQKDHIEEKIVDLNEASLDDLANLPCINIIKAKKIIQLRGDGHYIISYDDLRKKLNLTNEQLNQLKEVTTISEVDYSQRRVIDF